MSSWIMHPTGFLFYSITKLDKGGKEVYLGYGIEDEVRNILIEALEEKIL